MLKTPPSFLYDPQGLLCEARVLGTGYEIMVETIPCGIGIISEGNLEGDAVASNTVKILTCAEHDFTIGKSSLFRRQRITL